MRAICLLVVPLPLMAQAPAWRGEVAGVVAGYVTEQPGIAAGMTLAAIAVRRDIPDHPELHLETGFLLFNVSVPCPWSFMPSPCRSSRSVHALGTLRAAFIWASATEPSAWYAGFGVGGYFPIDEQDTFSGPTGGVDLTGGFRGLTASRRVFVEGRLIGLMAPRRGGGALSVRTGLAF
jgi:hypothetical protein